MTNAEARFNNSLRPRKPEGSLGRTAQDGHLDSHTAPELWGRQSHTNRISTPTCVASTQVCTELTRAKLDRTRTNFTPRNRFHRRAEACSALPRSRRCHGTETVLWGGSGTTETWSAFHPQTSRAECPGADRTAYSQQGEGLSRTTSLTVPPRCQETDLKPVLQLFWDPPGIVLSHRD